MSPTDTPTETLDAPRASAGPRTHPPAGAGHTLPRRAWKGIVFVWKYLAGAILCLNLLTSVVVVGWVFRLMQRSTFRYWYRRGETAAENTTFASFAEDNERIQSHRHAPNWIVRQNFIQTVRGGAARKESALPIRAGRSLFHSLWLNVRIGAAAAFNTWVLTLPACTLWLFAWYAGWNNSFHKGYEQAAVGPLTGMLGIALFIVAMLYVPMAQARQAATGHWRSFYDFPLVWGLVRRRWWACVGLAALYALLSVPVMAMKTAPAFFDRLPGYPQMTDAQVLAQLNSYFFFACLLVFPAYIALRLVAARIYAAGLLKSVRAGHIPFDRLARIERSVLDRLGLLEVKPAAERHVLVKTIGGTGRFAARFAAGALAVTIWFVFISQIYISEFLNYHAAHGWLNQPLIQLPWFKYIPAALTGGG